MTETNPHADLTALFENQGPFVSVSLDTHAATETGPEELRLRWRALRDKALGAGGSEPALIALDAVVEGSHLEGRGLVAIAAGDDVVLTRHLRDRIDDRVSVGPLPCLLPLIEWHQEHPDHAVVVIDRAGAEVHLVNAYKGDEEILIEGSDEPVSLSPKGGWRASRIQRRVEGAWETNAKEVADELHRIVKRHRPSLVIVAGDVRAVQLFRDNVDQEIQAVAHYVDGAPEPFSLEEMEDELDRITETWVGQTTDGIVQRFLEERGQADLATEGLEPTFDALRKSQVDTLLISTRPPQDSAWFLRGDPSQAAVDRNVLESGGLDDLEQAPAEDVLVAGAIARGATVHVLPDLAEEHGPKNGVGAVLRFRTDARNQGTA